ncbi:MAG TPA: hypothetical protein VGK73_08690 [Polyangiaceae bacterium]
MTDNRLRIEIESSGEVWDRVTSYSISESFFTPADGWEATVYSDADPKALRRKFQPRTNVRLYLGERLQLIGQIDTTEGAGGGSAALKLTGRDYMARLIDPNVDKAVRITNAMSLETALLEGLRVFGVTTIEGDLNAVRAAKMGTSTYTSETIPTAGRESFGLNRQANALSAPTFVATVTGLELEIRTPTTETVADAKPNENEGAYEWANRLSARCGFTVQPGSKRSAIAVVAPDYSKGPQFDLARPGNIEDGKAKRDYSGIPTLATLSARQVTAGTEAKGKFKTLSIVGDDSELALWRVPEARRILEAARAIGTRKQKTETGDPLDWYCPVYYKDDESKTEKQLNRSARRMMADRIRETLTYSAKLKGHQDPRSRATYAINVLAKVKDDLEDVDETLWISERTLTGGLGETTELQLIRPSSYVL